MIVNEETWHKLIWGWLRLFLAFAQVSLAAGGLALLLTLGLHWITFAVVIGATAAMATSRLLYHGIGDSQLQKGKHNAKR